MSGGSPIDSLRKLSAVSDVDAAALFGVAGRDELLDNVMRTPLGRRASVRRTPRSRRRLVVAFAAVAVVTVATAATWAVLSSSAHETTSVDCVINGTDTIIPSISGDPAYDCAVTWRDELGTTPPALAAYNNGVGGVSVIPRSDKPDAGWTPLPAGQDVALIQLQDSLDDYIGGLNSSCLDTTSATTLAKSKLAQFGFADWSISIRSSDSSSANAPAPKVVPGTKTAPTESTSDTRLCVASDIVDPSTHSVTLIPTHVAIKQTTFEKLAANLRPVTQTCQSLSAAVASVRSAATGLGLSESARTYELNAVRDNSLRCASIYETVGGTIFLTIRGPSR